MNAYRVRVQLFESSCIEYMTVLEGEAPTQQDDGGPLCQCAMHPPIIQSCPAHTAPVLVPSGSMVNWHHYKSAYALVVV